MGLLRPVRREGGREEQTLRGHWRRRKKKKRLAHSHYMKASTLLLLLRLKYCWALAAKR